MMEEQWKMLQDHLGYNDEEMKTFRANPMNEKVLSVLPELMNKTIILEVVESRGCNSRHLPGDKFYFDGAGNLLTKLSPKRICAYALSAVAHLIFASNELSYAGVDPNEMLFKHVSCPDVGLRCGGWGQVVMEFRIEDRK